MHKFKIYIVSSMIISLLISCQEKSKKNPITGVFYNKAVNQYAIFKDNKLLYPLRSENKYKVQNKDIIVDNKVYTHVEIKDTSVNFDSIEISYNTDNYETLGIKEFDAKIAQDFITFYDVENNRTEKIKLDRDFKKWIDFSLDKKKMNSQNLDKTYKKFILCLIKYKDQKAETIYSNSFNDNNNDLRLFMTLIYTYLSINKGKGIEEKNQNLKSLDSLNTFIDKNNIGIKRVPLPTK